MRQVVSYPHDITKKTARKMVLNHHYSGRVPGISHCFGLLSGNWIAGCVVYSIPASYTLCKGVCGPDLSKRVLELSRLVILTPQRNAASFLIGQSLQQKLPDSVVVSYRPTATPT